MGEIAYRCGFRTQSYFNVKFCERFGCSPREWVKSHAGQQSGPARGVHPPVETAQGKGI
ncbi:MAG: AraC family transcriptional regulator [Bacteroidaceae bacterium]|nr:AraC family transcriptional regulator [Bacteroidaceae bacterium]